MNNKDICDYISKLPEHKTDKDYYAEEFVKNGLGQTTGGYLGNVEPDEIPKIGITQKKHFQGYYGNIPDKKPTYNYLRCPQLILFIAEAFGVPPSTLKATYDLIEKYEKDKNLIKTRKHGNYLWGEQVFRDFKSTLKIGEVNRIIRNNNNIEDIKEKVKELFK
ncbi:MAG: hypothetical protein IKW96_08965 [Ruminococcus sp.]|uniref:hypothetical protein n=1 Tax=Ruminococcus sp. TaxID=41978 RepID=UPI0025F446D9|nr:hypothetical protein [Ruminococcus sp.]MBR5683384.1 hypothetical protein [Ruminococcus sp.]